MENIFYLRFLFLKREREREICLHLSFSLSLSKKEISLYQTLQVLLDYGVLGNTSDTKLLKAFKGPLTQILQKEYIILPQNLRPQNMLIIANDLNVFFIILSSNLDSSVTCRKFIKLKWNTLCHCQGSYYDYWISIWSLHIKLTEIFRKKRWWYDVMHFFWTFIFLVTGLNAFFSQMTGGFRFFRIFTSTTQIAKFTYDRTFCILTKNLS